MKSEVLLKRLDALEQRVSELENQNTLLKSENKYLKKENTSLKDCLSSFENPKNSRNNSIPLSKDENRCQCFIQVRKSIESLFNCLIEKSDIQTHRGKIY